MSKKIESTKSIIICGSKNEELRNLVLKYAKEALDILQKHTSKKLRLDKIILCHRMTSAMGLANYYYKKNDVHYSIKISSKIFTKDCRALKETVYHEVAHIVDRQLHGFWGHGKTWIRLMEQLGVPPAVYANQEDYENAGYLRKVC